MPATTTAKTPKPGRVSKKSKAAPRQRKRTVSTRQNKPTEPTASLDVDVDAYESEEEANSLSDEGSFIDEIQFEADEQCNEAVFTPANCPPVKTQSHPKCRQPCRLYKATKSHQEASLIRLALAHQMWLLLLA